MKTIKITSILAAAIYLFFAFSAFAFAGDEKGKVNAEQLITNADRAMLFIVKAAQETQEEKLRRSNKESEPFWAAVKKINTNVDKLIKYNYLEDESFHKTLAEAVMAKEEMLTTYELLDVNDSKVKEGIDKLSASIDLLYQNYSKEAVRMKQGESLTAEERAKFDELKTQNKELLKKLDELEVKVSGNQRMLKKIKKIKKKSNEVVHCHHNSAGFFFAMSAMHMINGWMWGCHWWWGPWGGWYPGFYYGYVDIYITVIDDYAYDWGYLDGVIDAYEYELEVELEMELYEMEAIGDYMDEIEIESELFDLDDFSYDDLNGAEELLDNNLQLPEEEIQPLLEYDIMEPAPAFEEIEYLDDLSDVDLGGFEEW